MQGSPEKRLGAQGGCPGRRCPAGAAELEQLVRNLREPYGKIAVMYFLEHKESTEIAKLVGRPPATINSQLWRAKLLLRQQITERRQNE